MDWKELDIISGRMQIALSWTVILSPLVRLQSLRHTLTGPIRYIWYHLNYIILYIIPTWLHFRYSWMGTRGEFISYQCAIHISKKLRGTHSYKAYGLKTSFPLTKPQEACSQWFHQYLVFDSSYKPKQREIQQWELSSLSQLRTF